MILGLTGRNGSGKGLAADYFIGQGYLYVSLSDILREEARRRQMEVTRANLYALGNELRRKHGPGVLAERTLEKLRGRSQVVVDSIRHPDEVRALRRGIPGFRLICIEAPPEVRFERMKSRGREKDPQTLEAFRALEEQEGHSANPADQQLAAVLEQADIVFRNDGTPRQLFEQLVRVVNGAPPAPDAAGEKNA